MATHSFSARLQVTPPLNHYFTFSIDVAATLELYCDGGDEAMLEKLDGVQSRQYAGYCTEIEEPNEEQPKHYVISVRPVQQGLTKSHPRKPQHARPTMCVPILPTTTHPTSRKPLAVTIPLPWDNCYHPTCYDLFVRVPMEWRDYQHSSRAKLSPSLLDALKEDRRHGGLLRAGLDDGRIMRIINGLEDAPETGNASETDSQTCKTFFAKVPGTDESEEDAIFVPVMRIDHVLSNVPEISDPSQLYGDVDLFQEIVQDYQLARYGSAVFYPPEGPEIDDTPVPDNFSMTYSLAAVESRSSLAEDLSSNSPHSHELHSASEESHQVAVSIRKGKWRLKSLFRRAVTNFVELVKWRRLSNKL